MEDGSKITVLKLPSSFPKSVVFKKITRKSVSRILYPAASSRMPVIYLRRALLQNLS